MLASFRFGGRALFCRWGCGKVVEEAAECGVVGLFGEGQRSRAPAELRRRRAAREWRAEARKVRRGLEEAKNVRKEEEGVGSE